jgi:hypothetical protein
MGDSTMMARFIQAVRVSIRNGKIARFVAVLRHPVETATSAPHVCADSLALVVPTDKDGVRVALVEGCVHVAACMSLID